jgi:hypothetical protein
MKQTKLILKNLVLVCAASLVFVACKKNASNDFDTDVRPAEDNSIAEATYNDVHQIADEAVNNGSLANFREGNNGAITSGCATVTLDTVSTPRRVVIDFGTSNCLCSDGKNRRGKIIVTYTGRYKNAGTVITHSFDNYFVNDNQVLGTKTVTNNGTNAAGNMNWTISVNGQVILANGGGTITWVSNRNREMIAGAATPTWGDDIYLITGTGNVTSSNGRSCTFTITTPLRKELACRFMVSGVVDITPANRPTRTLNFGSGACDNQASVTILGTTYPITLRG